VAAVLLLVAVADRGQDQGRDRVQVRGQDQDRVQRLLYRLIKNSSNPLIKRQVQRLVTIPASGLQASTTNQASTKRHLITKARRMPILDREKLRTKKSP
jgi:hypothetical protein